MTAELVSCTSTEISRYISAVISNAWLVQGRWGGTPSTSGMVSAVQLKSAVQDVWCASLIRRLVGLEG